MGARDAGTDGPVPTPEGGGGQGEKVPPHPDPGGSCEMPGCRGPCCT